MPNLFDALNTDLSSQQAGEAYHSQVDPLVEATTEVNKANVVDTAQQEAWDKAQKKGAERTRLENEIAAIKVKISNLESQLAELNNGINNFNKPMSDEEIMRIGEQLNVPEVATNYLNARSGRLNREFEAKKYDVAKDESKKTRKADYESSMRGLTTEINLLKDKKNNAAQVDKSGYDEQILGKQKELKVLDDEYSDEFGNSYLSSVKVDNTPAPTPNTTTVDTKPSESTTTEVDTKPSESTTTTVVNTESSKSIVPKDWGWNITESGLTNEDKDALRSDVKLAEDAIAYVKGTGSKSWDTAKTSVIAAIKGDKATWPPEKVKTALTAANAVAQADYDQRQAKKNQDADDKAAFKKLYDRRIAVLNDPDSKEEDKAKARQWLKDNSDKIKQYKLKQY